MQYHCATVYYSFHPHERMKTGTHIICHISHGRILTSQYNHVSRHHWRIGWKQPIVICVCVRLLDRNGQTERERVIKSSNLPRTTSKHCNNICYPLCLIICNFELLHASLSSYNKQTHNNEGLHLVLSYSPLCCLRICTIQPSCLCPSSHLS